jgi:hypothetical protein
LFAAAFCVALISTHPAEVAAQQAPNAVYATGNAAVTGFSGASPPIQIAPGVDPNQQTFIDLNGPSLRIVDLQHMDGPQNARLVGAPKPLTVSAALIGQVFGVALDDETPPNIYAAATSAYGLPIVAPGPDGQPQHLQIGAPNATFMPGLWGPQGGPGSIWKIDGKNGQVSLFANVALNGRTNSGAALGGLAYDPDSKSLFVADRETGLIHRFGLNGEELGRYDHGVTARATQGLPPAPWNGQPGINVASPQFDSGQPSTWNYAAPARRVFGLAVYQRRLYYAVAEGLLIWSVGLNPDGSFANDAAIELAAPPAAGPTEISKIAFDEQGRMFLAERPAPTGAFDFEALAVPALGRVLRYAVTGAAAGGQRIWQQSPDEYPIGFPLNFRNDNGGVAIGYSYNIIGEIARGSCGGFMWTTGEDLRHSSDAGLAARLARSGALDVNGLQGNGTWRIRRDDKPPLQSYFIEYQDGLQDDAARGHMGDIAIERLCAPPQPASLAPPAGGAPPSGGQAGGPPPGPPPVRPPGPPPVTPVCPPGKVCPPTVTPGCPPGKVCPPTVTPVCPPGKVCPPPATPGCPPGQTCPPPVTPVCPSGRVCPPGSAVPVGVEPQCQPGQTAIAPSNFCCSSGQVYTNTSGGQACCSGQVVNGQCQPPTPPPSNPNCSPGSTNPQCCAKGYVSTGSFCCLASQMTSTNACCPSGQTPSGPNKNQCVAITRIPIGPRCCASGLIPTVDKPCCPAANITTSGGCCSDPVDPNNRTQCPAKTEIVPACAPGYSKMPDGACCNNRFVSADGKLCNAGPLPCAPGEFRDLSGACAPIPSTACPPDEFRDRSGACVPIRSAGCPPGEARNRDGVCVSIPAGGCPAGEVRSREGVCAPAPSTACPPGEERNRDGVCVSSPAGGCPAGEVRSREGVCAPGPSAACPPGEERNRDGVCVSSPAGGCPSGEVRNREGVCAPGPSAGCPSGEERNRDGVCVSTPAGGCPAGEVRNREGACAPAPSAACPSGEERNREGVCAPAGPSPRIVRPGRPQRPFAPPGRERAKPFRSFAPPHGPVFRGRPPRRRDLLR